MKLYRDLQPGETLEAGDEQLHNDGAEWVTVETVWIGRLVPEDLQGCFRRPVNLPVLQPVTPEAMAELESRCASGVLVASEDAARVLNYSQQLGYWWRDEWGASIRVDRPWRGWFIELSKLREVQQ